jgi:DNA (cytosine-5)-methyltransferase 1
MSTVADFFAGSGLVSKGLSSKFETIWANDIDPDKKLVFDNNIQEVDLLKKDISLLGASETPFADLYWASFPCQDLSLAGNYVGLKGKRSSLVGEFFRILENKKPEDRPPVLALENVYGLITSNGGNDYREIHKALEKLGYRVGTVVLDAAYWVPQSRVRVFVVCSKREIPISHLCLDKPTWCHPAALVRIARELPGFVFWSLPEPTPSIVRLKDVVDRVLPLDLEKSASLLQLVPAQHVVRLHQLLAEDPNRVFGGYKRTRKGVQQLELRFDEIGGCLRTAAGGSSKQLLVYAEQGEIVVRYMTAREAARLMGADEAFWLPERENISYTAMGDGVVIPVTRFLSENLLYPISVAAKQETYAIV